MEESTQSLNKAKNMAAQEIRRIGLGEDVVGLVSEDIEFGLSTEEVFRYAKSGLNIKQMSIYSKCLRNKCSQEVINVITTDSLNANQMSVALDFFERGVPIETIRDVIDKKNNAFEMSQTYQGVLDEMEKADTEVQVAPEYVKSLFEEIKNVVSSIKFDESRYDELNEKLKIFESFKEDVAVRDNLVKQLSDKDTLLSDQQDKINQANSSIARLREEKENMDKEMKKMQSKVDELQDGLRMSKQKADLRTSDEGLDNALDMKTDNGILGGRNSGPSQKSIQSQVKPQQMQQLQQMHQSQQMQPAQMQQSVKMMQQQQILRQPVLLQIDQIGTPYVSAMPAYYNMPVADANGNVMQTVPIEKEIKKSTMGVIKIISNLMFKKKSRQDIVKLVATGELIPPQLALIKTAIEKGLTENQLIELINNKVPADQMKEIIEIAVLENELDD